MRSIEGVESGVEARRDAPRRAIGGVKLEALIVSAPFGNYVQPEGATATLGTFTAERRPGRFWQVLRTVRYYPRIGAWVNKIGLRNPGIEWFVREARAGRIDASDKIVSIHGFSDDEWWTLLSRVSEVRPLAVELNMSCPNVGHVNWPVGLFDRALGTGLMVIVKLPPVNFRGMAEQALAAGVRVFHCCNTLPVPSGGLSGKPLKPVSIQCIGALRELARTVGAESGLRIIGGGGITVVEDIDEYARAGVHHVAIGTKAMNPVLLWSDRPLRGLVERARTLLDGTD
ncbi:MAG: hypothetical protein JNK58_03585 [Phycisphaerae bacterium]|nr:hypothetical protein [Phycisphaerae bacterium]